MGFVARRVEATPKQDTRRIKRWIATYDPASARAQRKRWHLKLRLIAKAREADQGKTISTRGMSDDQFLALPRR